MTFSLRPLSAADLDLSLDPAWFAYETTQEVEPLTGIVGQPRALRALELGLGVRGGGYNVFVVGLSGTNLARMLEHYLRERARGEPTPCDWVYLNNFDEPDRPLAFRLPAGQGAQLKRDLREFPQELGRILPRAMQYQGFDLEKDALERVYLKQCDELLTQIQARAREHDLFLTLSPDGDFACVPLHEGEPLPAEAVAVLPPEDAERFNRAQVRMLQEVQPLLDRQQTLILERDRKLGDVERTVAEAILTPMFEGLWKRYSDGRLRAWLERVKQHVLGNLDLFLPGESPDGQPIPPPVLSQLPGEYQVNLVVDNAAGSGPPVVIEEVPTYKNLFGFVERTVDALGRIMTHFTQIKVGSLVRANGGYAILNLDDAIDEPQVWKELKRTLKNRRVHIDLYDPNVPLGASGIKPEAIPLDVKVLVVGSFELFYALSTTDAEFSDLFKVKAEFVPEMPLSAESCRYYAGLARLLGEREGLRPFTADAVAELVRYGCRLTADRRQLAADFSQVAGLMREAEYWCGRADAPRVTVEHVRQALEEQVYRSNWFATETLRLTQEGSLLIEVSGRAVGRLNSLTVVSLGDYTFGRPVRLTATAWVGQSGVINIERESQLSGPGHDKGMLIMEGYLRGKYAQQSAISLGASLAFEQTYGGVDGDSASAAELFCLVSALAELPLRQDVAVTGSVNQHGQIQAIGGVNEKIEGFFDVCRLRGLTGEQGVCFPRSNLQNLVLRDEVRHAVVQGSFHLWAIDTLDEGLEVLTGMEAGDVNDPETVHGRVAARFHRIAESMREAPPPPMDRTATATGPATPAPPAPPSLPPHG